MRRVRKHIQAVLAFSLLAVQVWLPWSVSSFVVTQDGPSHLYTAMVARDLATRRDSPYAKVYRFNPNLVPNWGTTVGLGLIASIAGVAHAEQLFISLAVLVGFFAFSYAVRALSPEANRWTPLANFLFQSWFLWLGFYNFYLAMALCPLVIGYYCRHASAFTLWKAVILACGMVGLYLTHLVPAILAGMAVSLIALWVNLVTPGVPYRIGLRRLAIVGMAFVPVLVLSLRFAGNSRENINFFNPGFTQALAAFPMHVFTTSFGPAGNQVLLYPAILGLIILAMGTMRRADWQTVRGGLAISVMAAFAVYLLVPDAGLGGKEVKIRFAWGVFVLGGLLLATAPRLRFVRIPVDIYIFVLLINTLISTRDGLRNYSHAVDDYLSATSSIPRGSTFLRLNYPVPDVPAHYSFLELGRNPLFHLDSYVAAQCGCIDLTDYQAPNNVFPVVFNPAVGDAQRYGLWGFEGPGPESDHVLGWLQSNLPVPIDYVILVADTSTPGIDGAPFQAVLSQLNSTMHLVGTSSGMPFVHVYQRNQSSPPK